MDPLVLALLGYPLSILANLTYDYLKDISKRIDIVPLKGLLISTFYRSLEYHDKSYDEYSKEVVKKLKRNVKRNEDRLLLIFSKYSNDFGTFLSLIRKKQFQRKIAEEIIVEYSLDLGNYPRLMVSIITDCLNFYLYAFFNQMNEKEGIQAILIECLKMDTVLDILKKMDTKIVTKNDFDELRKIVLFNYYSNNKEAQKNLEDYDQYLQNKFKYLSFAHF